MTKDAIERTIERLAAEVREEVSRPALIGIRRGGVGLTARLAALLDSGSTTDMGFVDIALYRDDAATALPDPKIGPSHVPFDLRGRDVVLVDDVLQTGRTIRAAIDCIFDYGRPRRIYLLVLCDRGGRELPISADFVGKTLTLRANERLEVTVHPSSREDDVVLRRTASPS